MAEEQVETAVIAPKSEKKKSSYSKTGKLVMDAIVNLNEKKGSSIMKIRNYISSKNPEIDMTRYGALVKKFVLSALEKGELKSNDETKGSRGYFKIVDKKLVDRLKKAKKQLEAASEDEEATTSKIKPSKNASPKVKKPVKKTIKMPSAVTATTTKKKSKPKAKSSPTESDKESAAKGKKKASGTKRSKKNEDEAPVPKKMVKKDKEGVEKPKGKAKPKKTKEASENTETVEKESKGKKKAVKDVELEKAPKGKKKAVKEVSPSEETETVEKSKSKKKAEAADKPEKAPAKKNKNAKGVNDENKE